MGLNQQKLSGVTNMNPKYVIVGLFTNSAEGFPTESEFEAEEKIKELQQKGCNTIQIYHLGDVFTPEKFSSSINEGLISE